MLELPETLRDAFKEPLGTVYTDPEALLAAAGDPLVAVGDAVTDHLFGCDVRPCVAVIDGHTERERVGADRAARLPAPDREVSNPAGTLSRDLLVALRDAVESPDSTVLGVDGEEDLAALPALLLVPDGGSVVYGQPGEGMVLVTVGPAVRERALELLTGMDGDVSGALATLGVDG